MIRLKWALKLIDCLRRSMHYFPNENAWCHVCDTGDCMDCNMPIFWHEPIQQYRHMDPDKTCFLIQDNGGVEDG